MTRSRAKAILDKVNSLLSLHTFDVLDRYLMEIPCVCSAMNHQWSSKVMPRKVKKMAKVVPRKVKKMAKVMLEKVKRMDEKIKR